MTPASATRGREKEGRKDIGNNLDISKNEQIYKEPMIWRVGFWKDKQDGQTFTQISQKNKRLKPKIIK